MLSQLDKWRLLAHLRRVIVVEELNDFRKYMWELTTESNAASEDDWNSEELIRFIWFIYDHLRTIRSRHLIQIRQTLFSLEVV